eukprot:scaffold696_cov163-Ochromonas_danica.AAC.3
MGNNVCPCLSHTDYSTIPDDDHGHAQLSSSSVEPFGGKKASDQVVTSSETSALASPPTVTTTTNTTTATTATAAAVVPADHNPSTLTSDSIESCASNTIFHPIPEVVPEGDQFDKNSSVFKGMVVEQKFYSKSSYDPKFVWINLKSRVLCLSEHNSRDRSHKEAALAEITGLVAGPPNKYKGPLGSDGKPIPLDPALCLSIKFARGGEVDLKFQTSSDRDLWNNTLARILLQQKELERLSNNGQF